MEPTEMMELPFDKYLKQVGGVLKRNKKKIVKKEKATKFKKLLDDMGETKDGAQ